MPFTDLLAGEELEADPLNTTFDETLWTKHQQADETNNTTALQNSTYLSFALPASSEWIFSACTFYTADALADFKVDFSLNGSATDFLRISPWGTVPANTGTQNSLVHSATDAFVNVTLTAHGAGAGQLLTMRPTGFIDVDTAPATFRVKFAQNTAHASLATLRRGSYVQLTRVG
ncbi:MAG: hypothetical protein ACRDTG_29150 [Pseudonocardiaceae bacterium]